MSGSVKELKLQGALKRMYDTRLGLVNESRSCEVC